MRLRLAALALLACTAAVGQQYPFIPIPGAPKNIDHMLQDRQGRLWIGTLDDVLCFDGTRFFSLHQSGFPTTTVFTLAEDDEGGILIGSQDGAYRFFSGRLEKLPPAVIAARVTNVAPGLLLITGTRTRMSAPSTYRVRREHGVWRAAELTGWTFGEFDTRDASGAILTACPGGWCEYSAHSIAIWTSGQPASPLVHRVPIEVRKVVRDRSGCLWFRTLESAAYQCAGNARPVPLPVVIAGRNVWAGMEETSGGAILFANAASLALGRPGAFESVTPENGLPEETIQCAIQAKDGAIWAGSINGLYRFPHPFRLTVWKSRYGPFWSIIRSGGKMFAGTSTGIATLGEDGEWRILPATRGLGSISSLLAEADGSLYAAVSGETVIHVRMPGGSIDGRLENGRQTTPRYIARAADGSVWFAGDGYYRLSRKRAILKATPDDPGLSLSPEPFLASDPRGALWGCFSGAVIHREAAGWRIAAREGVPTGLCRSLAFSGEDTWAGYNTGFAWLRPNAGAYKAQTFADSGPGWTFGADKRGWLWRGSIAGMFAATEAQAQRGVWPGLGADDGLGVPDVNHNSFFSDSDGSVWWSAASDVFHFSPPENLAEPPGPPQVFVSAISVGAGAPKLAETAGGIPFRQKLTAHLASLRFEERYAVRIRYRLLPEQQEWRAPSSLDLDLGTPSWGNHTLQIQSRIITGDWGAASSWRIAVMRPWWFTWPALLGLAAAAFAGAAGGARWRRKMRRRARNRLPDLDDWRGAVLMPEGQLTGLTLDGRFQILRLITKGGFAAVLQGRDLRTGRRCAIKIFRQDVLNAEWAAHRFEQEVSALEQIRHPSVVSIYGHGAAPDGARYLAMELIEGCTLRDVLKQGPLAPRRAASLLRQAGEALGEIHARGIIHRDVKPENLMLRENAPPGEELVLIDFSIAIVQEPDRTLHGLSRAAGTIYYMAPEQAVGFAAPASDVYSLAKVLLEMLTGQKLNTLLPDAGMDLPEKTRDMARARTFGLSEESVELLGAALEFDPVRRPHDARLFTAPIVRDLLAPSSGRAASPGLSSTDGESGAG